MSSAQLLVPNMWPVGSLINIVTVDESKIKSFEEKIKTKKDSDKGEGLVGELLYRQLRVYIYLFVAYICYSFAFPSNESILNESISLKWWFKWSIITTY